MKHTRRLIVSLLLPAVLLSRAAATASSPPAGPATDLRITMGGSPLGIAWGFLYGYEDVKAQTFMPELRRLGAGFTKIYLIWNQVEPEKGRYDWSAVDAFVDQLKSPEEGLIALFSSSQWAVKRPSALLPPSPAKDPDDYYRFVHDLVKHCKGRVRYWQNDAEPNNPIYWSGTKEEFVAQLKVFHRAVKAADPAAVVVVGGYDGLFGPPGTHQYPNQQAGLDFFEYVIKEGSPAFDIFDLRLYADPYTIPGRVDYMRGRMIALGQAKPIICTEYGGPNFFEFAENRKYIPLVVSYYTSIMKPDDKGKASGDAASENQIKALYDKFDTLAPETQMFMQGCSPELKAKYERIQARGLVMRNVFALSAGVQKTLYWQLIGRDPPKGKRDDLMTLMYGKIGVLDIRDGVVKKRHHLADVFERMARALDGVRQVKRIEIPDKPSIFLFEVDRGNLGSIYVAWDRRDALSGEDSPAVPFDFPWAAGDAIAVDALGQKTPLQVSGGRLHLSVSLTPVFIEPSR